jgi:hypothetical protein
MAKEGGWTTWLLLGSEATIADAAAKPLPTTTKASQC